MATAGSLDFVLSANSSQLRQELGKVRQESQTTALAITNLFSGDTINAVGFKLARNVITGTIRDIDELNAGLSLTESLTRNAAAGFLEMGDIALLQLGQIASFLGDDLFETPLAGLQRSGLESVGLGQLEGAFQIITAGSNAVKLLQVTLGGATGALNLLDAGFGAVQGKAQAVADFFKNIAQNAQLASSVLVSIVNVIDTAIEQLFDALSDLNPAFKATRDAAKSLGIEFSLGKSILGDYINQINQIDNAATTAANATQSIADGAESARRGISSASNTVENFGDKLNAQQKAAAGFESAIQDLADAGQLLSIYNNVNAAIEQFTGSLEDNFNAAKGAETLRNRLELVSTAAGGATEDLAFLRKLTDDLGIDSGAAAQGYVQFSTAANLANLSIDETRQVFEGVTQASSAFGLSAADTQGVFLALQQALSSGNVQLEELNQLAERIPGTFQAAASALGVTTSELKKLISTGTVQSDEFLPRFAQELAAFTESGVVDAMNSGEAAVNRFNNALGRFGTAAGQAWLEVGTPALNTFAKALDFAAKNEELFSTAIDAILVASLPLFIGAMTKATSAVVLFFKANQTATLTLFGQQISATAAQIGKFAAQVALAYAATIIFYRVMDRAKDSAEGTRSAIASLDRSLLDVRSSSASAKDGIDNLLPRTPPPTDWLDAIVDGFNKANRAVNDILGLDNDAINSNPLLRLLLGDFTTQGEKALNDQLAALGDFAEKAQAILGESLEFRSTAKSGQGPLQELKNLEASLKAIEAQRLKVDPADSKAIEELAKQETDLLKRQGDAREEVSATQTALSNALKQAQQELQNLDPSKLGTEGYAIAKERIETQITLLGREKEAFDALTNQAQVTTQSIAKNFEDSSKRIDRAYQDAQAAIQESLASGAISQEQAQQQQLQSEQDYLEQRLQSNRSAAEKLRSELDRNAKLQAVDSTKATLSTEQEKEYQQQLEQIEVDINKTRIDLAKNTLSSKQQLVDEEIASIKQAQDEANSLIQRSENSRVAAIKQRQNLGKISEADAAKQIAAVQQQSIASQVANEQSRLEQVNQLRASGVLGVKEAAAQEREILTNLSNLNLQRIEAELQARRDANQQILGEFEEGIKRAEAAIASSENSRSQALASAQLAGLSPENAASEATRSAQAVTAATLQVKQEELNAIAELRDRGVISAKEAASRESDVIKTIGDLRLRQIESEIQAQENLINAVQSGSEDQLSQVELSEAQKTAAVKQAQADRVISEELATQQIAELNRAAAAENLQIKQAELAEINRLRQSGELTIDEASDREKQLMQEIAQLRQSVADAEIARQEQIKQSRLNAIDQALEAEQSAAEVRQGLNEIERSAIESQTNLLSAQSNLIQAQAGLRQQRLQAAIAEAEQEGRSADAARLKKQLFDDQYKVQQQQAQIELQQLELQQEQNLLALQNAKIQAEIAVTESQIAIQKAIANNATAEELGNLQKLLGLRQQQLSSIDKQAAGQSKINALEEKALKLKQQQTAESLRQQDVQAAASSSASSASGATGGVIPAGRGREQTTLQYAQEQLSNFARQSSLADAFNASQRSLGLSLQSGSRIGGLGNQAALPTTVIDQVIRSGQDQSRLQISKLDEVIRAVTGVGMRPNLSIESTSDLSTAGRIYRDISRDQLRSQGL